MARSEGQKRKLLLVEKILLEKSDEQHPVPVNEIIRLLGQEGVEAERKGIYRDIEALREVGVDIENNKGVGYYVASRTFEIAELKLLADAVQASRSISAKKSLNLIKKLQGLVSVHQAKSLNRQIYVSGRVKTENESLFYNTDSLHEAINSGKKISFNYYEYAADKTLCVRRGGELYTVSPYMLCWDDENYYLVAYHDRYSGLSHFRVDKMKNITILDEPARNMDIDIMNYAAKTFGMFAGEAQKVEIDIPARHIGVVIDRFGKKVYTAPAGEGRITVALNVAVSPAFFSWVFMLGDSRITYPETVKGRYNEMLKSALEFNTGFGK